jgi:hypothetical protein
LLAIRKSHLIVLAVPESKCISHEAPSHFCVAIDEARTTSLYYILPKTIGVCGLGRRLLKSKPKQGNFLYAS